jgi:hypothetical protein
MERPDVLELMATLKLYCRKFVPASIWASGCSQAATWFPVG